MTLTDALRVATNSLASSQTQLSTLSRNIAGVNDPDYVRRDAEVYTDRYNSSRVEVKRYVDQATYRASILANAGAAKSDVVASGLNRLASLQDKDTFAFAPSRLLADLQRATELAAASPADSSTLATLVEQARTTASGLNSSYNEILSMRADADDQISSSVERLNSLLAQLQPVNDSIVHAAKNGRHDFDGMDLRDQLINKISSEIGVNVVPREDDDFILTTDNGILLFEGRPREITFESTPSYGPNTDGGILRIDGVAVNGPSSSLPLRSGRIAGNLELRDNYLVQQRDQLDEVARGLVELYSETDQSGGTKPALAGLFTWSGGPTVPASATLEAGIARTIQVNSLVDPQSGGNPQLIRDGAINGDTDYQYNTSGGASFSDRLFALSDAFNEARTFDVAADLPTNVSLTEFATASLDFLSAQRKAANDNKEYKAELAVRFKETLQGQSGPNLDHEMSRLLEVERAYQATARLLRTVDEMLVTLMESVA